ncbi:MAG: hypothetical protein KKE46_06475, partial [Gammaproteobacteria bacterium]|nr:hypothetical protein [Gammaproteobacteria bacterium]
MTSPLGPKMTQTLSIQMRQAPGLDLRQLTESDRGILRRAQRLWENKQHFSVRLPIAVLKKVLNDRLGGGHDNVPGLDLAQNLT